MKLSFTVKIIELISSRVFKYYSLNLKDDYI